MKKLTILAAAVIVTVFSLSCKKVDKKDPKWKEARLTERVTDYQNSIINNDIEDAWELTIDSKLASDPDAKRDYIKMFKESNHMASYYDVKFTIDGFTFKRDKAAVKMSYLVKGSKNDEPSKAGMYDYWQFKDGDWYYVFGGKDEFYDPKGWW